jgi:hypothetical protein
LKRENNDSLTLPMMVDKEISAFNCQEANSRVKAFVSSKSFEKYAADTGQSAPLQGDISSYMKDESFKVEISEFGQIQEGGAKGAASRHWLALRILSSVCK